MIAFEIMFFGSSSGNFRCRFVNADLEAPGSHFIWDILSFTGNNYESLIPSYAHGFTVKLGSHM